MGSKPNKPSSNKETVQRSQDSDRKLTIIPLHGVSFSYLLKTFSFTQGEDFNEVCKKVKKLTKKFKDQDRSFANYLKSDTLTSQFVKEKADVFISYAWLGSWKETMEALKYHFRNEKLDDVFIWMDFVCIDQHKNNELDFKDWSRVFQTSLEQIGKAVIAVVPAENPIVATRSWCCFEMTQMVRTKIKYDICISPNDTQKLIKDMQDGQIGFAQWNTLFSLVNVEHSRATKTTDQAAILTLMNEIGLIDVNNIVLNALKNLYVTVATAAKTESTERGLVNVLNARAALHQALGEYDQALPFYQEALEATQVIPNNETIAATQLNNLALLLQAQGKLAEAKPLLQQSLAIRKKALGVDHPDVAQSLNNLAQLLQDQGKPDEAKPMMEQAIAIFKKVLGEDHPNVATLLNNLALLLSAKGDYVEAEKLVRQGLKINEKALGVDHVDYGTDLVTLGQQLQAQGKMDEAKTYFEKALDVFKKALGSDHPFVATTLNNLAVLLSAQGNSNEAESMFRQVLEIKAKVYGPDHPSTAATLNNLALSLSDQGKLEEAESLYQEALKILKKAVGEEHPNYASTLSNLASLLKAQGKFTEAEPLYRQAMVIEKKVYGEGHPDVAKDLNNLAKLLRDQGNESEARLLGKQAYAIALKSLGKDHSDVINTYKYWETF